MPAAALQNKCRALIVEDAARARASLQTLLSRQAHEVLCAAPICHVPHELSSLTELPPQWFDPANYASKPPAVQTVQQRILDAGGLHLVVPEYNGSFPGVLKFFIDMLKFPESFGRKPVAFVGEANG